MNDQPLTVTGPNPFSNPSSRGPSPLVPILLALLGLGSLGFGVLAITFYAQAQTATKTLAAQKAAAAAAARSEQQKADEQAATLAAESPFRSYTAPAQYGSFEIKFPKSWSSTVDHEATGTQVKLTLNPDFIRRTNGLDEPLAAQITLQERTSDQFMTAFASLVKSKKLKQDTITVSGQNGFDLTGSFADKRTTREVVIPVRDKVLVFANENGKYASEFNQILAQAKIVP